MKNKILTILCICLALTGGMLSAKPIQTPSTWKSSEQIARVPDRLQVRTRAIVARPGSVSIPGLKAVLIGAPIDGDSGTWTTSEIKNLQMAAAVLRANNVQVFEFYTPRNNWDEIKRAANGAHFLLYRGHGVYDGNTPPGWVGGFSLKSGFFSSESIKQDLRLAPGAIVMLYGCFTAGNSGFDMGRIDQNEAKRRVAMYSLPFMQMGASGYYADWFGDAFAAFLTDLFDGKTLGDSYKSYSDFNASTVSYGTHPDLPAQQMWLDHDVWDGKTVYNFAFVGQPAKNIRQLFAAASPTSPSSDVTPSADPTLPVPPRPTFDDDAGRLKPFSYYDGFTWQALSKSDRLLLCEKIAKAFADQGVNVFNGRSSEMLKHLDRAYTPDSESFQESPVRILARRYRIRDRALINRVNAL